MTSIQVICRFRPNPNSQVSSPYQLNNDSVSVEGASFNFDRVFAPGSQDELYTVAAEPVIKGVLEGFNGTVVAYGQTASGKTYTMNGGDGPNEEGIINRMVGTVFQHISNSSDDLEFRIKISVVEIYMEKIRDLLNPQKSDLKIREDKARGIYIQDVTENYVSDQAEIYDSLKISQQNRQISHTNMNEQSSRSHMIFFLTLTTSNVAEHSAKTGRLFLVDLAGSEKVSKTGAEGRTLDEAKGINKSLMALGQVINALTTSNGKEPQGNHIPYRSSKLTRILQCSFGGNSRTNLIITCSQEKSNLQETLTTLRFGNRAKNIKNKPKINKEYTVEELKTIVAERDLEIVALKEMMLVRVVEQKPELDQIEQTVSVSEIQEIVMKQIQPYSEGKGQQEDFASSNDDLKDLKNQNDQLQIKMQLVQKENESLHQKISHLQQAKTKNTEELNYEIERQKQEIDSTQSDYKVRLQTVIKNISFCFSQKQQGQIENNSLYLDQMEQKLVKKEETQQLLNDYLSEKITSKLKQIYYQYRKLHKDQINDEFIFFMSNQNHVDVSQQEIIDNLNDQIMHLQKQNQDFLRESKKIQERPTPYFRQEMQNQKESVLSEDQMDQLQKDLQDLQNLNNAQKKQMESSEKNLNKKCQILENNLDGMFRQFHEVILQKSQWYIEYEILVRKIHFKDEKLKELENQNNQLSEENQILFIKYDSLKEMMNIDIYSSRSQQGEQNQIGGDEEYSQQSSYHVLAPKNKIQKPVRGGSGMVGKHKYNMSSVALNNQENNQEI